ncbi:MAG: histidine phosphatase family protein [Oscillospiraceae bacterium]
MRSYKLHLIRHGLTGGNLDGRYIGGGTDEPLCEKGVKGIEFLMENYEYPMGEKIYTSPMRRAVETCELLYPDCDYTAVDAISECNFGEFENKTLAELSQNERFNQWLQAKSDFTPEGGESNQDFAQRCANGLNQILTDMMTNDIHEGVCVCHGGVIAVLLGMFSYPQRPFHEWASDSGCGFTIITTTEMWTRDNVVEAVEIVPSGWGMDDVENDDSDENNKNDNEEKKEI